MSTHPFRRASAAVVLTVGLLIAAAAPALASATHFEIQASSTIRFHNITTNPSHHDADIHFDSPSTTNVCAPNLTPPDHIPVDLGSTGSGTFPSYSTSYSDFIVGANSFKTRLNIVSGTTNFTTTGVTVTLTLNMEIRNCASTTLLCRTNNFTVVMTGTNPLGTHHPTVSSTFTVSGISTVVTVSAVPSCNAIIRVPLVNHVVEFNLYLHATDSFD